MPASHLSSLAVPPSSAAAPVTPLPAHRANSSRSSSSALLPHSKANPSAPPPFGTIELTNLNPPTVSNDRLYYDYDPYADYKYDTPQNSADDGGFRMYEVDLNDKPRPPPPLPPRPSWSPSITVREQSSSSSIGSIDHVGHRSSVSLSTSTSVSPFRYVHSTEPRPPTVLDSQQLHARTLTIRAEPLWFRIHNTVLRLHPVAFDDLPEMTLWLNRAKFSSDRIVQETHGRLLCSLRWLMSDAASDRFEGMRSMLYRQWKRKQANGGQMKCDARCGTHCDMEYFFYGDDVGILYREWPCKKSTWRGNTCCVVM